MRLLAKVFPVGRLDIDTHGLLLTNNGKLAHAMLSPKKHVENLPSSSSWFDESIRCGAVC